MLGRDALGLLYDDSDLFTYGDLSEGLFWFPAVDFLYVLGHFGSFNWRKVNPYELEVLVFFDGEGVSTVDFDNFTGEVSHVFKSLFGSHLNVVFPDTSSLTLTYHLSGFKLFEVLSVKIHIFWGRQFGEAIFEDFRRDVTLREENPADELILIIDFLQFYADRPVQEHLGKELFTFFVEFGVVLRVRWVKVGKLHFYHRL